MTIRKPHEIQPVFSAEIESEDLFYHLAESYSAKPVKTRYPGYGDAYASKNGLLFIDLVNGRHVVQLTSDDMKAMLHNLQTYWPEEIFQCAMPLKAAA